MSVHVVIGLIIQGQCAKASEPIGFYWPISVNSLNKVIAHMGVHGWLQPVKGGMFPALLAEQRVGWTPNCTRFVTARAAQCGFY